MNWKNTLFYFTYQTIKHAHSWAHFQKMWSLRARWVACLQPGRNSVTDEQAWLSFPAIDFLDAHLRPEHRVFEYGGGGSTLFFCQRAGFVATVENYKKWFDTLTETVRQKGIQHWEGQFVQGEPVSGAHPRSASNPADFASNSPGSEHLSYEKYAKAIQHYPKAHFDVVLVDGRSRPSCIQECIPYLKSGGFLVADNMERDYYWTAFREVFATQFKTLIGVYYPLPYHPDFVLTVILQKI